MTVILCSEQQSQTDLLHLKSHLQLKVGLIEELLAEYGGILIDRSQKDSEMRERSCQPTKLVHVPFIHFNSPSY